jgi:hypothetical protein
MSLLRIVNLLQNSLFLLFCAVGLVFVCVDVHWFYLLDRDAQYESFFWYPSEYEMLWYLDCFTFVFMYLWLAVKLLRLACNPRGVGLELQSRAYRLIEKIRPFLTFDTAFKIIVVVVAVIILKHALGHELKLPRLIIISDVRPMANIWYDIVCPIQWLWKIIF